MTNTELLAKIKAEIERLKSNMDDRDPLAPNQKAGYLFALADVLSFISTLESEKPMNQEGLEEEINRLWESFADEMGGPHNLFDIYARLARHFAQWGAEHAKIDVTDFCKPIDPGIAQCIADHSWEMLGEDEKPVPKDLEEAAEDFVWEVMENDEDGISDLCRKLRPTSKISDFYDALAEFFKAGAKWQYQKDRGKFAQIKAKTWCEGFDACKEQMPLPEDTVLFNKGVEEGKRLSEEELSDLLTIAHLQGADQMKEQMMKDGNVILTEEDFDAEKEKSMEWGYNLCKEQMMKEAVAEVEVGMRGDPIEIILDKYVQRAMGIFPGDKVRIIIVKEDEK